MLAYRGAVLTAGIELPPDFPVADYVVNLGLALKKL